MARYIFEIDLQYTQQFEGLARELFEQTHLTWDINLHDSVGRWACYTLYDCVDNPAPEDVEEKLKKFLEEHNLAEHCEFIEDEIRTPTLESLSKFQP